MHVLFIYFLLTSLNTYIGYGYDDDYDYDGYWCYCFYVVIFEYYYIYKGTTLCIFLCELVMLCLRLVSWLSLDYSYS